MLTEMQLDEAKRLISECRGIDELRKAIAAATEIRVAAGAGRESLLSHKLGLDACKAALEQRAVEARQAIEAKLKALGVEPPEYDWRPPPERFPARTKAEPAPAARGAA